MSGAGITAAYVDIDQLGISVPAPADDPERYRLKAENLAAIVAQFRADGAQVVVVSGTCDVMHVQKFVDKAEVTLCRLQLSHEELRARLAHRGWDPATIDAAVSEAAQLDASTIADVSLDTTAMSVADVVDRLRETLDGWPFAEVASIAPDEALGAAPEAAGDILWLCGPTGVGKSTVGWEVFVRAWRDGRRVSFIDLQQIGFLKPVLLDDPDNHRLKAHNLAALWSRMRADGAELLVMVGTVDDHEQVRTYADTLPEATVTLVRLHAGHKQLTERIRRRGEGEGPAIPGDRLVGRDPAELTQIADQAMTDAARLAQAGIGDVVIDTDSLAVTEIADTISRQINWSRP
jgi:hypothetical protein